MSLAIDEEARRAVHPAADPAEEIGFDLVSIVAMLERAPKLGAVQSQLACKRKQDRSRQPMPVGINSRMHLPK